MRRGAPLAVSLPLLAVVAGRALTPAAPLAAQDTTGAEDDLRFPPAASPDLLREARPSCVPLALTVDAEGGEASFSSVAAALHHAAREDACAVVIRLRPGEHGGSFRVDRDTEIRGLRRGGVALTGTVSLRGPHSLRIRSLHLRDAGRPGAVIVDHPEARLELRYLTIAAAEGHGVRQQGGELVMDRVNVFGTRALAAFRSSGVGIALDEGVRARLSGVTLSGNENQALVARGRGTRVQADGLRVVGTGHRTGSSLPTALLPPSNLGTTVGGRVSGAGAVRPRPRTTGDDDLDGTGAVEVTRGATLLARRLRMSDNEWVGLQVHRGGRAHLRNSVVRGTRSVDGDGGVNVGVVGGTAELGESTLAGGGLAGLVVAGEGSVLLRQSTVARNPVGVAVRGEHPLDCLRRGTRYVDNGVALDSEAMPVPDTGIEDLEGEGDGGVRCARVPWR